MHYRERPRWRAAGAVGWTIVLAVLPGCGRPGASAAGQRSGAAAVKAVAVTQTELQRTTTQPATVRALFQTAIRARVSGYVDQLHVDIGDPVEAGQALLALDVPELDKRVAVLEARIRRLLADQSRAEAQIALAEAAQRSAEAKLAQASAELARSQATLTAAAAELRRTEDLVQRQSLQSRVLDEVRKRHDSEQAGVEVATSAIQSAQAETAVAEAQVQAARADLESAEAETEVSRSELDELRVMVDFATLRAPFDGVITERRVEPGDLVRKADEPSQGQPLLVVSQIDKVRVQIPVPEADAAYLQAERLFPRSPEIADRLARMYERQLRFDEAAAVVSRHAAFEATSAWIRQYSRRLAQLRNVHERLQATEQAWDERPGANLTLELVHLYGQLELIQPMENAVELLLGINGLDPEFYPVIAALMREHQNRTYYQRALVAWARSRPEEIRPVLDLAAMALSDEDFQQTFDYLLEAMRRDRFGTQNRLREDPRFIDISRWQQFQQLLR